MFLFTVLNLPTRKFKIIHVALILLDSTALASYIALLYTSCAFLGKLTNFLFCEMGIIIIPAFSILLCTPASASQWMWAIPCNRVWPWAGSILQPQQTPERTQLRVKPLTLSAPGIMNECLSGLCIKTSTTASDYIVENVCSKQSSSGK